MSTRSGVASSFRRIRSFAPVTGSCSRRELASGRVVFGSDGSAAAAFCSALPARREDAVRSESRGDFAAFRRFRIATRTSITLSWRIKCAGLECTAETSDHRRTGYRKSPTARRLSSRITRVLIANPVGMARKVWCRFGPSATVAPKVTAARSRLRRSRSLRRREEKWRKRFGTGCNESMSRALGRRASCYRLQQRW